MKRVERTPSRKPVRTHWSQALSSETALHWRPMLHCHTTIWGRKYPAIVIEGVGEWTLILNACLSDRQQGAYTLKQTNHHANAEYRRAQDVINETVSLRLSYDQSVAACFRIYPSILRLKNALQRFGTEATCCQIDFLNLCMVEYMDTCNYLLEKLSRNSFHLIGAITFTLTDHTSFDVCMR